MALRGFCAAILAATASSQAYLSCWHAYLDGVRADGNTTLNRGFGAFHNYCLQNATYAGGGWDLVSIVKMPVREGDTCLFGPQRCTHVGPDAGPCFGHTAATSLETDNTTAAHSHVQLGLGARSDVELLVVGGEMGGAGAQSPWWVLQGWSTCPGQFGFMVDYSTRARSVTPDETCAYAALDCDAGQHFDAVRLTAHAGLPPHSTWMNGSYTRACGLWLQDVVGADNSRVAMQLGYWGGASVYGTPGFHAATERASFDKFYLFARSRTMIPDPASVGPLPDAAARPSWPPSKWQPAGAGAAPSPAAAVEGWGIGSRQVSDAAQSGANWGLLPLLCGAGVGFWVYRRYYRNRSPTARGFQAVPTSGPRGAGAASATRRAGQGA